MAYLQDAPVALRLFHHAAGRFQIGCDGLLHQHVDSGGEQRAGHRLMRSGGHGDYRGVHLANQFAIIGEGFGLIERRGLGGACSVAVHYGAKFDAIGFVNHTAVVLPELSGAHDSQSMFLQN